MPILGSIGGGAAKGYGITSGGSPYIEATGGAIYDTGTYRIHTFTSPGSLIVSKVPNPDFAGADYMVIGGTGGVKRHIPRTVGHCRNNIKPYGRVDPRLRRLMP